MLNRGAWRTTLAGATVAGIAAMLVICVDAAVAEEVQTCQSAPGGAALAASRARAFTASLTPPQRQAAIRSYGQPDAIRWSNLPIALAPRIGLRLGDLSALQTAAAERLLRAALSPCGFALLTEIRAADGVLMPHDERNIGWNPANYFVAFIGAPSAHAPWALKVDGHHIAYNITFNAARVSATPLFDGVEPVRFTINGREHTPLARQADAMRALSTAVSTRPVAHLEGVFRDVTRGSTPAGDVNFPITYPDGTSGRGVAYASLDTAQQAMVRAAMKAWVELPNSAVTQSLMADYLEAPDLAQTFVGVSGSPDLAVPGSYVRIDGPRVWIEFIVQPAVADPTMIHYHTIWRDKLADYGGAFGH